MVSVTRDQGRPGEDEREPQLPSWSGRRKAIPLSQRSARRSAMTTAEWLPDVPGMRFGPVKSSHVGGTDRSQRLVFFSSGSAGGYEEAIDGLAILARDVIQQDHRTRCRGRCSRSLTRDVTS